MKTIALLFTNFGPYHVARVTALHKKLSESNACTEVVGIELTRRYEVYKWETDLAGLPFKLHTVSSEKPMGATPSSGIIAGLKRKLNEIRPDVLAIAGYSNPAMISALMWCRKNGCKPVLMSESSEADFKRGFFKELTKRMIIKKFHSALVGGAPHKRYLMKLGMDENRIFTGYDVVDNSVFHPSAIGHLPNPCKKPYFLSINRFIKKKNIHSIVRAYAAYRIDAPDPWDLIICGDGGLKEDIEALVSESGLAPNVHLPGFLQQKELLPYFAHAGCFVHASTREQWGLVINEAMAAGLPIIVSNRCGCVEDLLAEGENGFSFDPESASELTSLMTRMSSGSVDNEAMGKCSLERIQALPPSAFAEGLLKSAALA